MSTGPAVSHYGVHIQNTARDDIETAAETVRLLGYAVVDGGLDADHLVTLRDRFDSLRAAAGARYGTDRLRAIGEIDLLRCPLADDPLFLHLACNPRIMALCEHLLGPGFILNQQNGIVNPAGAETYSQSAYHRDLPYQHFVSSRPLAINSLFCLDPFTTENGATLVIPASHQKAAFPSDTVISAQARQIEAPSGAFVVLDCMTYHRGGINRSRRDRRAVNHVYTIAMLRQQIDLPSYLGKGFSDNSTILQLLGFNHPVARSVDDYLRERASKIAG